MGSPGPGFLLSNWQYERNRTINKNWAITFEIAGMRIGRKHRIFSLYLNVVIVSVSLEVERRHVFLIY